MIKNLFHKFVGWLFSWQKEEPIILKEEPKQEEVKEVIVTEPEKIQCHTHSRFKKSCPICVEAAK